VTADRRLLIVHPSRWRGENHGVYVQHVDSLHRLLGDHGGWRVDALDPTHPAFPDAVLDRDVVVVHMLPHPEIETAIRLRRERGRPTVFELSDNFLGLGDWVPRTHLLRSPLVRQRLLYHAALCDAVQVYAPGLVRLISGVNDRVALFDPWVPVPDSPPPKPPGFRFGWGGTTSHEADLRRVAPVVAAFCRRHPDARFAYMGDEAMFHRCFAAVPAAQADVVPFGNIDAYHRFVGGLHVGLAPSGGTPFAAGRSDTKFVAYAAGGVAPVLEDAEPYRPHAARALLFADGDGLAVALERLHADASLRVALATRAFAWVRRERGTARLADQRDGFYRSLLDRGPVKGEPAPVGPAPAAAAHLLDLPMRAPAEALVTARRIVAEHPRYAQARWAVVAALDALGRAAEADDELARFDWPVLYHDAVESRRAGAARAAAAAGDGEAGGADAEAHIGRVRSPHRRLQLRAGPSGDRSAFFRHILEEQPYDFFALSATIGQLERDEPGSPLLAGLYGRLSLVAPEQVPANRRPAHLEEFLPA
jgi:hypothetical protein